MYSRRIWITVYRTIAMKDSVLTIKDNGAESVIVVIGEGNITYTEKRDLEYVLDRGSLDDVRENDEQPLDVSFQFRYEYYKGSASTSGLPSPNEALTQTGNASAWVSTDTDLCRPYAVDLILVTTPSPSGCGEVETLTFSDFRYEEIAYDIDAGTVAVTGRCNILRPTSVRA